MIRQQTLDVACLTLVVCLAPCHGADDAKAALQRRREQLARIVTRGDEFGAARAVRELLVLGEADGLVRRSILEAVRTRFREPEHLHRLYGQEVYVTALAELGEPAIPAILDGLKAESVTESSSIILLAALGHMGTKAKATIPELKRRREDPKASVLLKDCLRLVAANAGDPDLQVEMKKDLEQLLLGDRARARRGGARSALAVAQGSPLDATGRLGGGYSGRTLEAGVQVVRGFAIPSCWRRIDLVAASLRGGRQVRRPGREVL